MNRSESAPPARTATLRSPALYLGSIEVSEKARGTGTGALSGTRLKAVVFPLLHWLVRRVPTGLAIVPAQLFVGLLRLGYGWPRNRLRLACEAVARLAGPEQPLRQEPRRIYAQFLDNALGIIENFFALHRHGRAAVLARIVIDPRDRENLDRLIEKHGGLVLAVPHNVGSAFSALRIGHDFDMLLVAKNSPTIARTRIALEFYERMKVSVLMVRGGNPFALSRALFAVLRQGKLVAATLDNIDRSDQRTTVQMFGQPVGLNSWAAKVAVKMRVPLVPAWFESRGRELRIITGDAVLGENAGELVAHYARFFEQRILDDPASWAYLADKHWQRILRRAVDSHTGSVAGA